MILLYVDRGLGNQMFQYAFGIVLAVKTNIDVKFDISYLDKFIEKRKSYCINDIFTGQFEIATDFTIWRVTGNIPLINKLKYKATGIKSVERPKNKLCNYVEEPETRFNINEKVINKIIEIKWKENNNYYVKGFWENIKYFDEYEKQITEKFQFKQKISRNNRKKYHQIFQKNSVSIHIRRGDYLQQGKNTKFCLCDKTYYLNAMKIIEENLKNPTYIFFSDDCEYVEKEFKWVKNKVVVSGNKDYEDLQLMSSCAHNIVANSTFSFWGAFLNNNKEKIVIAPKTHYLVREGRWHAIDFPVQNEWIQIENL